MEVFMIKKAELLKTEHEVQLNWITNQVAKIANRGADSFLNADVAERAFEKLNKNLSPSDADIEHFVSVYLSKTGTDKLVITLRVYAKRSGGIKLQVELTPGNKRILDDLARKTGQTKIQIINDLIAATNLED